jgi:hypothetical protein
VLDAIDLLAAEIDDLLAKEDEFDSLLTELDELSETVLAARSECYPVYHAPLSATIEDAIVE